MVNDPELKDKYGLKIVERINLFCALTFGLEVVVKIIAMGFCKGKNTYFQSDGFNRFDFILFTGVCTSLIIQAIFED